MPLVTMKLGEPVIVVISEDTLEDWYPGAQGAR
jgi:hypothetical protein